MLHLVPGLRASPASIASNGYVQRDRRSRWRRDDGVHRDAFRRSHRYAYSEHTAESESGLSRAERHVDFYSGIATDGRFESGLALGESGEHSPDGNRVQRQWNVSSRWFDEHGYDAESGQSGRWHV